MVDVLNCGGFIATAVAVLAVSAANGRQHRRLGLERHNPYS